jgi:hypothetical protein
VSGVAACPRAALIYLHSSAERQRALASEVGKNAKTALGKPKGKLKRSGTRMARSRGKADESQQHTGHMAADLGFDRRARQESNLRPTAKKSVGRTATTGPAAGQRGSRPSVGDHDVPQVTTKAARLGESWTPRELRHSFVSILSAHDVRLEDISDLVGHSSTSVTETVYRHEIRRPGACRGYLG